MLQARLSPVVLLVPVLVLLASCGGAATTTTAVAPEPISAYFVGNSLTNGTLNSLVDDVRSYGVLARQADYLVRPLGWHIKCGASLLSIFENPEDVCIQPATHVGEFPDALPIGDWDYLVVQPYPGAGSTLATDIRVITELASMVSRDTTVAVFTGWPRIGEYSETWNAAGTVSDDSPTEHSRLYFDTLVSRLTEELGQEVQLVPTGEVLYRMQSELTSGAVPGLSDLADLYSDDVHLGKPGNWLSGVTAASVMTGADPDAFDKPDEPAYGDDSEYSNEYIRLVWAVVEEVLSE